MTSGIWLCLILFFVLSDIEKKIGVWEIKSEQDWKSPLNFVLKRLFYAKYQKGCNVCKGIFLNYVMVLGWAGTFGIAILALLGVGSGRFLGFTADFY